MEKILKASKSFKARLDQRN